jgi:hypothetical protein
MLGAGHVKSVGAKVERRIPRTYIFDGQHAACYADLLEMADIDGLIFTFIARQPHNSDR